MTDLTAYARTGTAYKWESIGDTLRGEITQVGELRTGANKFNPEQTETVLPFTVTADGEEWGVYARLDPYSSLGGAVVDAVTTAGETQLKVGGTIAIQYQSDLDTGKPQPAKIFVAEYKPPATGTTVTGLLGDSAGDTDKPF